MLYFCHVLSLYLGLIESFSIESYAWEGTFQNWMLQGKAEQNQVNSGVFGQMPKTTRKQGIANAFIGVIVDRVMIVVGKGAAIG